MGESALAERPGALHCVARHHRVKARTFARRTVPVHRRFWEGVEAALPVGSGFTRPAPQA
eukprot:4763422-Alexandrium_andersonii.AAC.1